MKDKIKLADLLNEYKALGIEKQIDYTKFYIYSIITHSTAIEGSTVNELENQLLFDEGIPAANKPIVEQLMNLDLKATYEEGVRLAKAHKDFDLATLKRVSALVMKNTGSIYHTALGNFDSRNGDFRLLNVSAGIGGTSYLSYQKVPMRLKEFCKWLNEQRHRLKPDAVDSIYQLSFESHYHLATIHPWADGNGRMARLVMNQIQIEFGVLPSKVLKSRKIDYIKSLQEARTKENVDIFCKFMLAEHLSNLLTEIDAYKKALHYDVVIKRSSNVIINKQEGKVLYLLKSKGTFTAAQLAENLSLSLRQVQRILASLKQKQLILHEGSNKCGEWKVDSTKRYIIER